MRQAWFGLAFWIAVGLLLEGLIAFRTPVYLQDDVRREMFRLAHAHGTLLSGLLLVSLLFIKNGLISPPGIAFLGFRLGIMLMPLGFLFGGIWHYESDPGMGVFLAPVGGFLILLGIVAIGFSTFMTKEVNE